MERYETAVRDGVLYLERSEHRVEIGDFEAIVDDLGEVYEIEYEEEQAAVPWLDIEDGVLAVDVREKLHELSFNDTFVDRLIDEPLDRDTENGLAERTATFTELLRDIWDPDREFAES